jgi:hypothetical protein
MIVIGGKQDSGDLIGRVNGAMRQLMTAYYDLFRIS